MKISYTQTLTVVTALSLVGTFANAEEVKKEVIENTITTYGLITLKENFVNSQRSNVPDFQGGNVRLGVKIKGGITNGQVELQYLGNQPAPGVKSRTESGRDNVTVGNSVSNTVVLRQAQLNIDLVNKKEADSSYVTTLSFGGVRVGGGVPVGPDILYGPAGYARQDGVYLLENMTLSKSVNIQAGFGFFNNLFVNGVNVGAFAGWGNVPAATLQANWLSPSFNRSAAYTAYGSFTYTFDENSNVNVAAYYGEQKDSPLTQGSTDVDNGVLKTVANVTHSEASLIYSNFSTFGSKGVISGNGIGVWYENDHIGRVKSAAATVAGSANWNYSLANAYDDSKTGALIGVGVAADSGNYLTDMLQKGDRLTYAVSYTNVLGKFGSSTAGTNYIVNTYSASVGYAVNTFELALNVASDNANQQMFTDSNGNLTKKSAFAGYLTGAYVF